MRNKFRQIALALAAGVLLTAPANAAPPVTSNLVWHVDASQLTGLTNGATVTTWTDMSGSGNHATATGSAATYQTGALNGLPVVRFNADGNASFNFTALSTIRTVFWVVKNTNPGTHFLLGHSNASVYDFHAGGSTIWDATWVNPAIKNGTTKLMGNVVNGTATALPSSSYSLLSVVTTNNVQANQLSLDRTYGGRSWAGDMAEVLIYDRDLTAEEEKTVGNYLTVKYGLVTEYVPQANMFAFGPGATIGPVSGNAAAISWIVPYGSNLAALSPIFTLSDGATGTVDGVTAVSGETRSFTNLVHYIVRSSDNLITNTYTVTVTAIKDQLPVTNGIVVWLPANGVNTNDSAQVRVAGADVFIKQWNDLSGNAYHAANATEGDQPKYIASGLNGRPALRFAQDSEDNGDRLYLGDRSANFPAAATLFVVATIDNDGRYNLFGNRAGTDERWVANSWSESRPGSFRINRSTSANFTQSDWPTTGSHVFALESSSSIYRILTNGVEIGSDTAQYHNGAGTSWTIANRSINGQQLRGDIAELILYNRVLTTEEANTVGGYLTEKYNLTTAYPPLNFSVKLTSPFNNQQYPSGSSVTAAVTVNGGTAPYTVAFFTNSVSAGTVSNAPYQLDLGAMPDGTYSIYATVTDSVASNVVSATHAFTVASAVNTVVGLTSDPNPSTYGQSVTFTATVSPTPAGGTVQFYDAATPLGSPAPVNTGTGVAIYSTNALSATTHPITAAFSGYGISLASTSSVLSHVVNKAPVTVRALNAVREPGTANPNPFAYQFVTDFKFGETLATSGVTGSPVLSTTAVPSSPKGDYTITCALGSLAAANYSFTLVNGTLTVKAIDNIFSVNFFVGPDWPFGGLSTDVQKANVRLDGGNPAGFGDWYTSGWTNYLVPWGLAAPMAPVTLVSTKGETATFTFKDCRNGWTYDGVRTTLLGDGNGNLMDAHINGTLEGTSNKFDMQMSNIPFGIYDVIFYLGATKNQFGDGIGVIAFTNGLYGIERQFTIKPGAFDGTFTEMVDAATQGNYIVFKGLTGTSFTTTIWGLGPGGFNHLGPFGFQVRDATPKGSVLIIW